MPTHGQDDSESSFPEDHIATRPRPKLRSRRSRREMMLDILRAVKQGSERPTQIMYKSNLSWSICQDLLGHLLERGLVEMIVRGERKQYELTPRGADVLRSYATVVEEVGNHEDTVTSTTN